MVLDVICVLVCWVVIGAALIGARTVGDLAPMLGATAATLLCFGSTGMYRSRDCARPTDGLARVALAVLVGAVAFCIVQWGFGSAAVAVTCALLCAAITAGGRWAFAQWLRTCRANGRFGRGVVLVGGRDDASRLEAMFRAEPELGYVVTALACQDDDADGAGAPRGGPVADIPALASTTGASGVLIVPFGLSSAQAQDATECAIAAGLDVELWPALRGVGCRRLRAVPVSGEAFFHVEPRCSSRWELAAKRVIDLVGAIVGLCVCAPVLAVAAALIKLDSPGPVFHRGERIGLHGKPFVAYKLRSMRAGGVDEPLELEGINERTGGPLFKSSRDPRVTRVGRFLRSSSIDEIPQLWNVLMGSMSLVGPRPALPGEVAQFDDELLRRHSVRPGVTGLWQVEARRNPSFEAYRRLDLSYIDNWSLWLDLSILAATVPSVLSQAIGEVRKVGRPTM